MRRAFVTVLAAAALLSAPGCFVRPWAIEESERIDRTMEYEVDDAEGEAFEGIEAPRWISPGAVVEVERRSSPRGRRDEESPRAKGDARRSRSLKAEVAFSGWSSKKR